MTVYIRTTAGNEAALNPESALPRKLRTLLISIDGRTLLSTYVSSLSSFGDVDALIESLLRAGLIAESKPLKTTDNPWHPKNLGSTLGDAGSARGKADTKAEWSTTDAGATSWRVPFTRTRSLGNEPVDDLASWSKFQQPDTLQKFKSPGNLPSNAAHYQLRNAVSLMSDFVSKHMPSKALELVLTLEGLTSAEQVIASLRGYESLISHVGDPALRHLVELRKVLSSS